MPDTFHGKRRLPDREPGAQYRDQLLPAAPSRPRRLAARISAARRTWIERAGAVDAATPMWSSRQAWLNQVRRWVASEAGRAACAERHIRPETVVRVAIALAAFADGATGRNCAPSNQSVAAAAGCSASLVTRIRNQLLARAGFAVEARRGTGGAGRRNRASVWHLIPSAAAPAAGISDLPTLPPGGGSSHLVCYSPKARKRAGKSANRGSGRRAAEPRPLAVQKLAAGLIGRSVGLDRVHPGQICDALTRSGLDLERWDAGRLAAALDADMRERGISWPDRISRPAAFLLTRLRRLPQQPVVAEPTPTPPRKETASRTVKSSSAANRRAALEAMRAEVAAARALWRPRLQAL